MHEVHENENFMIAAINNEDKFEYWARDYDAVKVHDISIFCVHLNSEMKQVSLPINDDMPNSIGGLLEYFYMKSKFVCLKFILVAQMKSFATSKLFETVEVAPTLSLKQLSLVNIGDF